MRVFSLVVFILLCACPVSALETRMVYAMGSLFQVKLEHPEADRLFETVFTIFQAYDQALSDYQPNSELNLALRKAQNESVLLSPILCTALQQSWAYARLTDGRFDITIGPLLKLWGFKDRHYRIPSATEIQRTRALSHWGQLQLQGCQFRSHAGLGLDFGGIGKGLALDAAATWLKQQGVRVAALDAGGSSHVFLGAPAASPQGWPVVIQEQLLFLRDQAVSSSGDDQQFFEVQDRRYSHIFNPQTGSPLPKGGRISVIADTATFAEVMSKNLLLLTPNQDIDWAQRYQLRIFRASDLGNKH